MDIDTLCCKQVRRSKSHQQRQLPGLFLVVVVATTSAARPSTGASAVAAQLSIVNLVIKCGNKFVLVIFALQFPRDFSHFEVTESTQRGIQFSLDLATLCSA